MSFAETELKVVRWGEARGIVQNSSISAQARKTLEEAGELLEAATALDVLNSIKVQTDEIQALKAYWMNKYTDALGDVQVTMTMGCAIADVDQSACFEKAYQEIKDRKGYLRADGVFVKESGQNV